MTFAAIWEGIVAFFKAIPILAKLFTKSEAAKKDDIDSQVDDERKAEDQTGRPKWN